MIETTNHAAIGMTGNYAFGMAALRAIQQGEPFVYAILTREGAIKIGFSTDVATRKRGIKFGGGKRILTFRPGDLALERDIHQSLTEHRIPGTREYYYPVRAVVAKVNWIGEHFGLPVVNQHHLPRLADCTFHHRVAEAGSRGHSVFR